MEDVDDVIALDAKWRDARWELDQANSEFNKANKAVSALKRSGEDAEDAIKTVAEIKTKIAVLAEAEKEAEQATNASRRAAVVSIGNGTVESLPNAGRGGRARARRVESAILVISAHFNRSST